MILFEKVSRGFFDQGNDYTKTTIKERWKRQYPFCGFRDRTLQTGQVSTLGKCLYVPLIQCQARESVWERKKNLFNPYLVTDMAIKVKVGWIKKNSWVPMNCKWHTCLNNNWQPMKDLVLAAVYFATPTNDLERAPFMTGTRCLHFMVCNWICTPPCPIDSGWHTILLRYGLSSGSSPPFQILTSCMRQTHNFKQWSNHAAQSLPPILLSSAEMNRSTPTHIIHPLLCLSLFILIARPKLTPSSCQNKNKWIHNTLSYISQKAQTSFLCSFSFSLASNYRIIFGSQNK